MSRSVEVLVVDDNPGDVLLTQRALKEGTVHAHLSIAQDGEEALAFLRRQGEYASAPRPDLILLDWNLPKRSGREVLSEIKRDQALQDIPVVVLTMSAADHDIRDAYALHANCYISKPVDYHRFRSVMQAIDEFWFRTVTLPPGD